MAPYPDPLATDCIALIFYYSGSERDETKINNSIGCIGRVFGAIPFDTYFLLAC
jgi:hypothetical protein